MRADDARKVPAAYRVDRAPYGRAAGPAGHWPGRRRDCALPPLPNLHQPFRHMDRRRQVCAHTAACSLPCSLPVYKHKRCAFNCMATASMLVMRRTSSANSLHPAGTLIYIEILAIELYGMLDYQRIVAPAGGGRYKY